MKLRKKGLLALLTIGLAMPVSGIVSIPSFATTIESNEESDSLPSFYDGREEGNMTLVKRQFGGSCGYYAITAQMEIQMKRMYGLDYDLSEQNFMWFSRKGIDKDEKSMTYGDGTAYDAYVVDGIGNTHMPVLWNWWSFSLDDGYFDSLKRKNAIYDAENKKENAVDSNKRYESVVHLTEWYTLSMKNPTKIKGMIKKYGAVIANIYSDDDRMMYLTKDDTYLSDYEKTDHAICIVGWDDNREVKGTDKKGAWLIRSSWGTTWCDGGYGWVSYEDKSINRHDAQLFVGVPTEKKEAKNQFDHIYNYSGVDGAIVMADAKKGYKVLGANIFKVEGDKSQEIGAVGPYYYGFKDDVYTVQIYVSDKKMENPEDGTLASTEVLDLVNIGEKDTNGAIGIVPLKKKVIVQPEQYYSVIIEKKVMQIIGIMNCLIIV